MGRAEGLAENLSDRDQIRPRPTGSDPSRIGVDDALAASRCLRRVGRIRPVTPRALIACAIPPRSSAQWTGSPTGDPRPGVGRAPSEMCPDEGQDVRRRSYGEMETSPTRERDTLLDDPDLRAGVVPAYAVAMVPR